MNKAQVPGDSTTQEHKKSCTCQSFSKSHENRTVFSLNCVCKPFCYYEVKYYSFNLHGITMYSFNKEEKGYSL